VKKSTFGLFIISYNRLEVLKESMTHFQKIFASENIYLIDKGSDYSPLIDYYKTLENKGMNIIYSVPMLGGPDGPGGLNDLHIEIDKYKDKYNYYAVTDPDISLEGFDEDILSVYSQLLDDYPEIDIVGPMLKIDDIPEAYPPREWCFRRHVDQFWSKKPEKVELNNKNIFFQKAKIDSTFGLMRSNKSFVRLLDGIRVYAPYEAKHLDWYILPTAITKDQQHYMDNSNPLVSNWGAKQYKKTPLHPILTKKERLIYTTSYVNKKTILIKHQLPESSMKFIGVYNLAVNSFLSIKRIGKNSNKIMRKTIKTILGIK